MNFEAVTVVHPSNFFHVMLVLITLRENLGSEVLLKSPNQIHVSRGKCPGPVLLMTICLIYGK